MVPSEQQVSTEDFDTSTIERAVMAMRLMGSIEEKVAAGTSLDSEEYTHLYQLNEPIYKRTRDDWLGEYDDGYEPEVIEQLHRYKAAQNLARESTLATLRESYGDDANWMLLSHDEITSRIQELLQSGATPALLAENLSPADQLRHFELLRAAGVPLDARQIYEAYVDNDNRSLSGEVINSFVVRYATELAEVKNVQWMLVSALMRQAEEGSLESTTEELLRLGVERSKILGNLDSAAIEARFQWLLDAGFDMANLLSRTSTEFIFNNFDTLFQQDVEAVRGLDFHNLKLEEKAHYIVALHRNGIPVQKLLDSFISGLHHSLTPQLEAFVAAGITIDDIVNAFSGDDESLIHLYAPWLMENGANPDAIKAKFSPDGIIRVYDALRNAGIEIDLQDYVERASPELIISRRVTLETEAGLNIDYGALFETSIDEITLDDAELFMRAGIDPALVFKKLSNGSIASDHEIHFFVKAGVPFEEVWQKASKSLIEHTYLQALTSEDATDEAFEAALKAVPLNKLRAVFGDIVKRPAYIDLFVDRLEEGDVNHHFKFLIENGADPSRVVHRITKGFWGLHCEAEWLLDKGVDAQLLFNKLEADNYSPTIIHKLIEAGVPCQEALGHLGSRYVANHFDELVSLGYGSELLMNQAMQAPTSQFVLNNIASLTSVGYSADQLSACLEPREVVTVVKELLVAGLSPALAITQVMLARQCSQESAQRFVEERLGIIL